MSEQLQPVSVTHFRRHSSVAVAALIGLAVSLCFHSAKAQPPAIEGSWEVLPYLMPVNPIHGTACKRAKF